MTILGTTEEITQCGCCGRAELNKTVVLESDSGDIYYYGVVCASKALNINSKTVKQAIKHISNTNDAKELFANAKGDTQKNKAYQFAAKKGLDVGALILQYGEVVRDSNWETIYEYGDTRYIAEK